jgi:hypothetical protein
VGAWSQPVSAPVEFSDDAVVEDAVGTGPVEFTVEQENLVWEMWRRGDSLREMERTIGVTLPRIRRFLRRCGGIRPAPRRRRAGDLVLGEREEVSRGIAARMGRAPSTITREIARNGGRKAYRALAADAAACERARRPKQPLLATYPRLADAVRGLLEDDWSPQQIAAVLPLLFPDDAAMRCSHEAIYRAVYTPSRRVFEPGLFRRLRYQRPVRRPRGKHQSHGRGRIRNMPPISDRPAEAEAREVPGHFEGDLVFGAGRTAVASIVDRATRYTLLIALPDGYKAERVADAVIARMRELPPLPTAEHDLGPGRGDGRARPHHRGAGHAGVLLRAAPPLAARHERGHKPAAAPVPAEERRPVGLQPARAGCGCRQAQQPAAPCAGLGHSRADARGARPGCDHGGVSASGLPDIDVVRARRWCECQVPERLRGQLRVECEVAPRHLTIVERRPPWSEGLGPDGSRTPLVRRRCNKARECGPCTGPTSTAGSTATRPSTPPRACRTCSTTSTPATPPSGDSPPDTLVMR